MLSNIPRGFNNLITYEFVTPTARRQIRDTRLHISSNIGFSSSKSKCHNEIIKSAFSKCHEMRQEILLSSWGRNLRRHPPRIKICCFTSRLHFIYQALYHCTRAFQVTVFASAWRQYLVQRMDAPLFFFRRKRRVEGTRPRRRARPGGEGVHVQACPGRVPMTHFPHTSPSQSHLFQQSLLVEV